MSVTATPARGATLSRSQVTLTCSRSTVRLRATYTRCSQLCTRRAHAVKLNVSALQKTKGQTMQWKSHLHAAILHCSDAQCSLSHLSKMVNADELECPLPCTCSQLRPKAESSIVQRGHVQRKPQPSRSAACRRCTGSSVSVSERAGTEVSE